MSKSLHSRYNLKNIKTRALDLNAVLERDLEKYNPTLKSILKVERLFRENIEFDSKNHLLRKLDGSMKAPVLNVILKYLKELGKLVENKDGSWTWIYASNNKKLKKSYKESVKL